MNEKFYKYLISKGYNETGAAECIKRIERGIADREDKYELEKYKNQCRKEIKNE